MSSSAPVKGPGGVFMTPAQKAAAESMRVPTLCPQGTIPLDARELAASQAAIHNTSVRTLSWSAKPPSWTVLFLTMAEVPFHASPPLPPPPSHPNIGNTAELAAWQGATATPLSDAPPASPPDAGVASTATQEATPMTVTPTSAAPAATAPAGPSVITQVETILSDVLTGLKDVEQTDVVGAVTQLIAVLNVIAAMLNIHIKI